MVSRKRVSNGRSPRAQKIIENEGPEPGQLSTMTVNNMQVGGSHYGLSGYQHWDYVVQFELGYFEGQVTKYVTRWRKKNGLEDLKKARHFLDKLIEEVEAGRITA